MKYSTVILVFLGLLVGFFATDIINILYKSNYLYAVIFADIAYRDGNKGEYCSTNNWGIN